VVAKGANDLSWALQLCRDITNGEKSGFETDCCESAQVAQWSIGGVYERATSLHPANSIVALEGTSTSLA